MKRIFLSFFTLVLLTACSQGENIETQKGKAEIRRAEDVKIPSKIFISSKQNSEIDEEEIKSSIKKYLDSHEELDKARYPFEEMLDEEKKFNEKELEKLSKITELTKQNDDNFSDYILNNTLPKDYQEASERISDYIAAYNEFLYDLNEMLDDTKAGKLPSMSFKSLLNKTSVVNGKKQKEIEDFLDKKNIKTKAFGREGK